jgi:hypothetical protein
MAMNTAVSTVSEPSPGGTAPAGGAVPALQAALAAEHAAVYGYGVLGARLRGAQQQAARDLWAAHRAKRDRLSAFIIAQKAEPVSSDAAYRLPLRPVSATTAVQLAAALEERVVSAYLGLVGVDDPKVRRFAAQSMQEAMGRAVRWGAPGPPTAFPGLSSAAVSPEP